MQAEPGFENLSMLKTARTVLKAEGILGLYRFLLFLFIDIF
jgi:hypothetical protein